MAVRKTAFILALSSALLARCGGPAEPERYRPRPQGTITLARDIAPILNEHCVACHRARGPAPFDLADPREARRRAREIAEATGSGFMPPWLPEPGFGTFQGERRLSADEIGLIGQWAAEGAAAGDPAELPEPPQFDDAWQLGTPDLVIGLDEPYVVPAEGLDVFRNLVIPIPTDELRYVRAVELLPGSPQVVHHAVMQLDRGRGSRRLDERDPEPGFAGMSMGSSSPPDGHFLGWTPGRVPFETPADMAWRLHTDSDLVLQLHLLPSGRPEPIRPQVGFYFSDRPPTREPYVILLRNDALDIAPGESAYRVTDEIRLPVEVDVLGIYPHAHYLGKRLHGYATLPDGSRRWLIRIDDWDFDWQDEYRYAEPLRLPAGAKLTMDYTYDNSAENVRNPSYPPQRVTFGNRSTDEMATLTVQVLPVNPGERPQLEQSVLAQNVEKNATDWNAAYNLAVVMADRGRTDEAVRLYRKTLALNPDYARAHNNLAVALASQGVQDEAIEHYREALRLRPDYAMAHTNLGIELSALGRDDEALDHFLEAARLDPASAANRANAAMQLRRRGRLDESLQHFRAAARIEPDWPLALNGLAWILATHPDAATRRPEESVRLAEKAAALTDRRNLEVLDTLAAAYAAAGRFDDAVATAGQAVSLARGAGLGELAQTLASRLALYRTGRPYRDAGG